MFGSDDPEALQSENDRLRKTLAEREELLSERVSRLIDALGDLFLIVEPRALRWDWEGSQTEHYARGFEVTLMDQAKTSRDGCQAARDLICKELLWLGISDPRAIGAEARLRRDAEARRARARELRAEADRLER